MICLKTFCVSGRMRFIINRWVLLYFQAFTNSLTWGFLGYLTMDPNIIPFISICIFVFLFFSTSLPLFYFSFFLQEVDCMMQYIGIDIHSSFGLKFFLFSFFVVDSEAVSKSGSSNPNHGKSQLFCMFLIIWYEGLVSFDQDSDSFPNSPSSSTVKVTLVAPARAVIVHYGQFEEGTRIAYHVFLAT
jgi:hypothetical protein